MLKKKLSIIIVTYNSENHIYDCLSSIYRNNDINDLLEIIVVDNNSENSIIMFEKLKELYCDLILIHNNKNGGYGQGNNLGIKNASGDIIMVMNPDVRLIKPIFRQAINHFDNTRNLALLGMKQWFDKRKPGLSFDVDSTYSSNNPIINVLKSKICNLFNYFNPKDMYINGSCFFIRKENFRNIGGFDENLFLYCEEKDVNRRLKDANLLVRYDSNLHYMHLAGNRDISYKQHICSLNSELYYRRKNGLSEKKCLKDNIILLKFYLIVNLLRGNKESKPIISRIIQEIEKRLNEM